MISASSAVAFAAIVAVTIVGNNSSTPLQDNAKSGVGRTELSYSDSEVESAEPMLDRGLAQDKAATPPGTGASAPAKKRKQAIERSATLTLSAPGDEIQSVSDHVFKVVAGVNGVVLDSSVQTGDSSGGEATFTLQVPSAKLAKAMSDLSGLAHVTSRSEDTLNVTSNVDSVQERLDDAKAERKSLLKALSNSNSATEIASLRSQLTINKSQLAQAKGDLRSLNNRTSFSTIDLTVTQESGTSGGGSGWGIDDAADDAVELLQVAGGVALITLAIGIPAAILIAIVILITRRSRRIRRESTLDA